LEAKEGSVELRGNPTEISNPHHLPFQLAGLIFWIVFFTWSFRDPVVIVIALILGGLTFTDAWISGIYKDPDKKSFLNISPMAWGIVMVALSILAYPVYVLNRNKLRTITGTNGFFYAVVVIGGLALLSALASIVNLFISIRSA